MGLKEELSGRVEEIFGESWDVRDGRDVPEAEDFTLGNEAVKLDPGTVLYADISESTALVDTHQWTFAAEVYKAFLYCAARILAAEGGSVTAYDGDRIMAVFLGDSKNT